MASPTDKRRMLKEYLWAVFGSVLVALLVRALVAEPFHVPSTSMIPTLVAGDVIVVDKLAYGPRLPFSSRRIATRQLPARGDVIVFSHPRDPRQELVRRVIGLPGDVVELRDGTVWVNGVPQPRILVGQQTYEVLNESTGQWWNDNCAVFSEKLAMGAIPKPLAEGEREQEVSWIAGSAPGVSSHRVMQCQRSLTAPKEGPFQAVAAGHFFVLGDNRDRSVDSRSEGGWQVPFSSVVGKATRIAWSSGKGSDFSARTTGVRFDRLFKRIE